MLVLQLLFLFFHKDLKLSFQLHLSLLIHHVILLLKNLLYSLLLFFFISSFIITPFKKYKFMLLCNQPIIKRGWFY
uniref:Uncharacterized protein n=1 Tax=Podoviridae sp. ct8nN1 TaxID=2827296 RepID=A0A8S5R478_9CAUD|nr:MAG TPA: hypothetical protein [Podoviridae sp. ct8nN1]